MSPPPPICLPFRGKKARRTASYSEKSGHDNRSSIERLDREGSYSSATLTSLPEKLTFSSPNSSLYRVDSYRNEAREVRPVLKRAHTTGRTLVNKEEVTENTGATDLRNNNSTTSKRWGYGWGMGKKGKAKEAEREAEVDLSRHTSQSSSLPQYQSPHRSGSRGTGSGSGTASGSGLGSGSGSRRSANSSANVPHRNPLPPATTTPTSSRNNTVKSNATKSSNRTAQPALRPGLYPSDSSSTLVGSALERKVNDVPSVRERLDTGDRLEAIRELMKKHNLDY